MTPAPSVPLACGPLVGERWRGDGPPVVLLHAGVADRRAWHEIAPRLAGRFDVIAYDRRGYGETPPPEAGAPTPLQDLVALLDEHVGGPVWLVGNSMGGSLALDLAVSAPERVLGVVGIGTSISGAPWEELPLDPATAAMEDRLKQAKDLDDRVRLHTWLWLDGPSAPEGRVSGAARELALDMCRTTMVHGLDDEADDNGVDAWAALPELRVPVTLAIGELDLAEGRTMNARAAALVPGAQEVVLPGTAHLPMLDAPQETLAVVERALGSRRTG